MKVEQVLHMVGGTGDNSYAATAKLPESTKLAMKAAIEEAIAGVYKDNDNPEKMAVADLGCSAGPNTLLVVSEVIGAVNDQCWRLGRQPPPELLFFLNDLPGNDFNSIFQSLESFEKNVRKERGDMLPPYHVAGLPGSFYERLLPRSSVHFVSSIYALMWRSQVPKGLVSESGDALNKGNIYIWKNSPPRVIELYREQFQKDFSLFLQQRALELVPGGHMMLMFFGTREKDVLQEEQGCVYMWGLLAEALRSMVFEGLVEEEKLDTFNLPFHAPSIAEVEAVVEKVALFDILRIQMSETSWDSVENSEGDNVQSGANVARLIRSVSESMITSHFGEAILEDLFSRFAKNVATYFSKKGKAKYPTIAVALKKRD